MADWKTIEADYLATMARRPAASMDDFPWWMDRHLNIIATIAVLVAIAACMWFAPQIKQVAITFYRFGPSIALAKLRRAARHVKAWWIQDLR